MTIQEVSKRFIEDQSNRSFKFNTPASDTLIEEVETILGNKLTDDLKYFYKNLNGIESDDNFIFRVIPLQEVKENLLNDSCCYIVAEYLIYSDTWEILLDNDSEKIVTYVYNTEKQTTTHKLLWPVSFSEFLSIYLAKDLEGLIDLANKLSTNSEYLEPYKKDLEPEITTSKFDENDINYLYKIKNWIKLITVKTK